MSENSGKTEDANKEDRGHWTVRLLWIAAAVVILSIVVLVPWLALRFHVGWSGDSGIERYAQVGDSMGPIASLLSSLALGAAIYSVLMQREELALQREEMKKSAAAQEAAATAAKAQALAITGKPILDHLQGINDRVVRLLHDLKRVQAIHGAGSFLDIEETAGLARRLEPPCPQTPLLAPRPLRDNAQAINENVDEGENHLLRAVELLERGQPEVTAEQLDRSAKKIGKALAGIGEQKRLLLEWQIAWERPEDEGSANANPAGNAIESSNGGGPPSAEAD